MKALIIENEYEVDNYVQAFLKDNPNLFESVQEELYCLHRGTESLFPHIMKNDVILIASTFMYKDQLEDFLDAFNSGLIPPKTFYVHWITSKLKDWSKDDWQGEKEIYEKIKTLVKNGGVIYDYFEDYESKEKLYDNLGYGSETYGRNPMIYTKVLFDEESNLFYTEHEQYDLETIKKRD